MNIQTARQWIATGHTQKALAWLEQQPDNPDVLFLTAVCVEHDKSEHWHRAIESLSAYPASKDLLLALGQGIACARRDLNTTIQEQYLEQAIRVAESLQEPIQHIHWIAILANFHLRQGNPQKALPWLQLSVQRSILHQHHVVTIAQGLILTGYWFGQGKIAQVSALSISIEEAAVQRHNWIALATARNTRASCLLIRKKEAEAIQLLLETGDTLFQKGAVAALNIIKARLGEIHLLLGQERVRTLIQSMQRENT